MDNTQIRVIFAGDAKDAYESLLALAAEEKGKGIANSKNRQLLNSINQKVDLLKLNAEAGRHCKKSLIPKKYIEKYDANNLWILNLTGYWRMIYTLRGETAEIIALVLDVIDHDVYNKLFGFREK